MDAGLVTTDELNAVSARIGRIEADYVKTSTLDSDIARTMLSGVQIIECTGTFYYQNKRVYIGTDGALYCQDR